MVLWYAPLDFTNVETVSLPPLTGGYGGPRNQGYHDNSRSSLGSEGRPVQKVEMRYNIRWTFLI